MQEFASGWVVVRAGAASSTQSKIINAGVGVLYKIRRCERTMKGVAHELLFSSVANV